MAVSIPPFSNPTHMIVEIYNQWAEEVSDICVFNITLHNCGGCFGFDLFVFGFGFAIRFGDPRM